MAWGRVRGFLIYAKDLTKLRPKLVIGFPASQVSRGRIPGSENAFSMVKMFLFTWIFQKYSFRHVRAKAQKREKETQNLHDLYRLHDLYHGECLVLLDTGTN